MKPTVKNWKIAIITIDVVFAIVAFDLVCLVVSTPPQYRRTIWLIGTIAAWLAVYVFLRGTAMTGKKKAILLCHDRH
jgi:uncharacterized membrane protein